jgi:hypothetical protein
MTTEQICKSYHGDDYPSCNPLFSAQLITRERKLFPVNECGQDRSLISKNATIAEKIDFLSYVSTSSIISPDSISHSSNAIKYFFDISTDVIDKLNKSNSYNDQGNSIYNNTNITNISRLIFTGHNGDCSTPSLGIAEICLIKNNTVICEYTNKNISYESYCLASFSVN